MHVLVGGCPALSGRIEEAHEIFGARRANHVGLFSEQIDLFRRVLRQYAPGLYPFGPYQQRTLPRARHWRATGTLIGTPEHRKALGHPVSIEDQ